MLIRIYEAIWAVVAIAFLATYFTGNLTPTTGVVFGFISFGLIFMGMMGVLPLTVAPTAHHKH